ncbi:MAG TPA: histidine kinase dimerization/phosphoacceptor domain -containing protein [Bryobacteraceae bacterium]|nr:histidine kinase dimerization/phosphoacceptor domain -containing protein [Bryobacteraceae bacterium]
MDNESSEPVQKSSIAASSSLLAQVIDLAEDAIISIGEDQRILLFNQGAARIFGYSAQEAIGKPLDILLPERMAKLHRTQVNEFSHSGLTTRRKNERTQIWGRRKDGTEFPAEASISRVDAGGRILLTVILRDITERVAHDQKLEESVREKEALLREIHHRVKNNLQVMSSLLGLQARSVPQQQARQAFEDSQGRIHSMALIHEVLCESPSFARIDIANYTRQLAAYRLRAHGAGKRISLSTNLDEVYLDLETAVPYGIIVNELLTNAFRHGFPGQRAGEIRVSLREQADQNIQLIVQDDGVGLPDGFDWQAAPSLGFRLVRMLAEQLKANMQVQVRNPTAIQLSFESR